MDVHDATAEYKHAIDAQKKVLEKAQLRKGQRPSDIKTRGETCAQFMLFRMSRNMRREGSQVHSSFVPPAYYPCITPLTDLTPILIRDLQLEIHHRGRYILVRSITPPCRMTGILTVVEDERGEVLKLQLYQQADENEYRAIDIIDVGTILLVKEPFFKIMSDGEYGLRVDHLSDIMRVDHTHGKIPIAWQPRLTEMRGWDEFKAAGNLAMSEKEYSDGLVQASEPDEIEVLKRNRSLAYLRTKQFDAALADTGYPNFQPTPHMKALFRAAEALYFLRRFDECCGVLEQLTRGYPEETQSRVVLDRARARVKEQVSGLYDFKRLQTQAKVLRPPLLDHASFYGSMEVLQTESKGRGLFTTRDVKVGELLLCEKAYEFAHVDESGSELSLLLHLETNRVLMGGQANLIRSIAQKLYRNPSIAQEFSTLHHGSYEKVSVGEVDAHPVVDTFLIDKIMSLNVFGCPTTSLSSHKDYLANKQTKRNAHHSCGIWTKASYINHCCINTARRAFIGDMMVVRATSDLKAGSEITFWYHSPVNVKFKELQKKLDNWGFECDCALCVDGRATSAAVLKERATILSSLKQLLNSASPLTKCNKIKRQLEMLEKTYTQPVGIVPRIQLSTPQQALAYEYAAQKKYRESLEWIAKALHSLGFIITGADLSEEPFMVVQWGLVVEELVMAFLQAREALRSVQAWDKGRQAEDYARTVYKISVGEDASFEATYGL